jgi:FixJ family two-component response regulator
MGRPIGELKLAGHERGAPENWGRGSKSAQALALRARMILLCAASKTNTEVAAELLVTKQTVGKWRQRFMDRRLASVARFCMRTLDTGH